MGSVEGFETVAIASAGGRLRAEFVPAANLVCHSLTLDGVELLHAGRGVRVYAEQGKTMGVPLLYPWANRLAGDGYAAAGKRVRLPPADGRYELDPNGLPRHGALPKLMRWDVQDRAGPDRIRARLSWTAPELQELFPFAHEVDVEAHVADASMTIATTVRATGEDAVPVSFGYHPYLRIPGIPRDEWRVELGATRRAVLSDLLIPTGDTEPLPERAFTLGRQSWDDALAGLDDPPRFRVGAGGRAVAVTFDEGYGDAQVYAPPGQDFICFEPMTAPTNALVDGRGLNVVAPGDEYHAAFTVAIADN